MSRDQGLDHDLRTTISFLCFNNLSKNSLLLKILDLKKYKDLNIINQKYTETELLLVFKNR